MICYHMARSTVHHHNWLNEGWHLDKASRRSMLTVALPSFMTLACNVRYFCAVAFVIFIGSILLCTLGFTVILPYRATVDWAMTLCRVVNASYSSKFCSCNRITEEIRDVNGLVTGQSRCSDQYPCLVVFVVYNISFPSQGHSNSTTFVTPVYRTWSDSFYHTVGSLLGYSEFCMAWQNFSWRGETSALDNSLQ